MFSLHRTVPARSSGFTLIELMIVVAIIGILGAIAIPAYQKSVMKGRRVDAKNALLDLAAREERYFSVNNKYSETAGDLGYTGSLQTGFEINTGGKVAYKLTVTAPSSGGFTATATPTPVQSNDACGTYTLNDKGVQSSSGTETTCW